MDRSGSRISREGAVGLTRVLEVLSDVSSDVMHGMVTGAPPEDSGGMGDDDVDTTGPDPRDATAEGPAVVAALDGSPHEDAVIAWAAAAAARQHARLELVHVVEVAVSLTSYDMLVSEAPRFGEQLESAARGRLDVLALGVRDRYEGLDVTVHTPVGSPPAVLVAMSERATVVVGAVSQSRLHRLVLGSTALAVAAHARGTVVVVPEATPPVEPHRVVVGADGSEGSARAVAHAVAEAATVGGAVTVVTAWTVEVDEGIVVTEPGPRSERVEQRLRESTLAARKHARAEHPDVPIEVVVRQGRAADSLLAVAAEKDADLVVVGSRGRGGFAGLLLGSVSRTVVQQAKCPVSIVR